MKSLSKQIGEGVFWFTSNNIIVKAVGLASIFLILRRFSVYEYGVAELVFSVISMFSLFLLPGLNDLILAEFGREKGQEKLGAMKKLLFDYAKLGLFLSVILWFVLFFGADLVSNYYNENIGVLFRISSFLFLVTIVEILMKLLLNSYLKFFYISLFNFLKEFSKFGFLMLFFFYFNLRMDGLFLAHLLSHILPLIVLAPAVLGVYKNFAKVPLVTDISLKQILMRHGKWAVLITHVKTLGDNLRLWLIKFLLGTEAVGLFAVALGLYSHTGALFPLNLVVRPIIPQYFHDKEKFYKLVTKSIKYQFLGYVFLGIVAFFVFPPIIVFLFPKYASSMFIFKGLLFVLIPISFAGIFTYVFYSARLQKSFFFSLTRRIFVITLFLPVFVYFFGTAGIFLEFILTASFVALDRYRILRKLLPGFRLRWKDFVTIDSMDKFFIKKIKGFVFLKLGTKRG